MQGNDKVVRMKASLLQLVDQITDFVSRQSVERGRLVGVHDLIRQNILRMCIYMLERFH